MEDEELNSQGDEQQGDGQGEDQGDGGNQQNRVSRSQSPRQPRRQRKPKKKTKEEQPKKPTKEGELPKTQPGSGTTSKPGLADNHLQPKPASAPAPAAPVTEAGKAVGQGVGEAAKDVSGVASQAGQTAASQAGAGAAQVGGAAATGAVTGTAQAGAGAVQAGAQTAKGVTDTAVNTAQAAATTAGTAAQTVVVAAETTNPVGWGLLAVQFITQIVIPSVIIFAVLMGFAIYGGMVAEQGRTNSLTGGTIELTLNAKKAEDVKLVEEVVALTQGGNPKLRVAAAAAGDLDWQTDDKGNKTHRLDRRTLETMKYLSGKWEVLGIRTLVSNGPDKTYRQEKIKGRDDVWEATSAFPTGQAMAIDKIGLVSQALADRCFGGTRVPVEVSWQKSAQEIFARPTYEQLWVDAAILKSTMRSLVNPQTSVEAAAAKHDAAVASGKEDHYLLSEARLALLNNNLAALIARGDVAGSGIDGRTATYAGRARGDLDKLITTLKSLKGEDYIKEWQKPETRVALDNAIRNIYRATHVANMVGWRVGDCEMQKAYEARQNIRALVAQVLYMPVEVLGDSRRGFNDDLEVKQMIVYSPEDDLDNGLTGLDIFPNGGLLVDEGGIAAKGVRQADGKMKVGDGKYDDRDEHFVRAPKDNTDNGIFSKASTIYLFKKDDPGTEEAVKQYQADKLDANLEDYYNTWDGALPQIEGYEAIRVSYKNFVHIAF